LSGRANGGFVSAPYGFGFSKSAGNGGAIWSEDGTATFSIGIGKSYNASLSQSNSSLIYTTRD